MLRQLRNLLNKPRPTFNQKKFQKQGRLKKLLITKAKNQRRRTKNRVKKTIQTKKNIKRSHMTKRNMKMRSKLLKMLIQFKIKHFPTNSKKRKTKHLKKSDKTIKITLIMLLTQKKLKITQTLSESTVQFFFWNVIQFFNRDLSHCYKPYNNHFNTHIVA